MGNKLIEEWKKGAKKIYDSETALMEYLESKDRTFTYKYLAEKQINMLEVTKPNKKQEILDQMNEEQQECYKYLQKVAETGEL